jgi:hypothetical protein
MWMPVPKRRGLGLTARQRHAAVFGRAARWTTRRGGRFRVELDPRQTWLRILCPAPVVIVDDEALARVVIRGMPRRRGGYGNRG